jgi:hypothetical protein
MGRQSRPLVRVGAVHHLHLRGLGFIATIRWIIDIVTGAERAVVSGVEGVENKIERK